MSQSPKFQNLYVARLVTQERPCFVCSKFTSVVLTSADNSNLDWFYVCRTHLGDRNFCTKLGGPPQSPPKSPTSRKPKVEDRPPESDSVADLVSSIGSALTSWRKKKPEEDEKKDSKEEKNDKKSDENSEKDTDKKDDKSDEKKDTPPPSVPSSPTTPTQPIRFQLQRDYLYLRQREYARKVQKKEAGEKLKTIQFPEVPKEPPRAA